MKSLTGLSLAVLASLILITVTVKGQTPVTRTPARIAPTPLELWRAEVAKWEAELKRIDAELAAAQQRPATPRPMQSQSRLQTSSLQPSGRTSSLPPSASNNQVLLQRQAAVQARLTNAQQQLARLESAAAQSSPPSTPAMASAAPGDPKAEAAKWNAEVTRLEQLLSRYGSGALSFAPPAGTDPKQFAQQREALQKQLTAARAQAQQANAKVSAMANASEQAGFAALPAVKDEFVVPTLPVTNPDPSYADTIDFINSRLADGMKMGFGKTVGKMILRSEDEVYVFDPKDLGTTVKYWQERYGVAVENYVALNGRNSAKAFELIRAGGPAAERLGTLTLQASDDIEAKKLARALSHLIEIFGGKNEAF